MTTAMPRLLGVHLHVSEGGLQTTLQAITEMRLPVMWDEQVAHIAERLLSA